MRMGVAVLFTSLLLAPQLLAADAPFEASLRNVAADVNTNYATIHGLGRLEGRQFFGNLSPQMRQDLWTLHLERFLNSHPDLSIEQRAVVFEAIGMLSTGLIERLATMPDAEVPSVDAAALDRLQMRILAVFSPEIAASAFYQLGSYATPDDRGVQRRVGTPATPREISTNIGKTPPCSCSQSSAVDFCDSVTNPTEYRCAAGACIPGDYGCGVLWLQMCTGVCKTPDPPPPLP